MLNTEQVANTSLNLRTIWVIFLVVVSFVLLDVTVSNLVDIYRNFTISGAGMSLFLSITSILIVGTYFILKMTADKIRREQSNKTYENRIQKCVWAVYYLVVAIMVFVILQIFFFSDYYTDLLSIAPAISYGLAACLMGLLAYRFFSWFIRKRSLVVLLYGLASVSTSIYVSLLGVIFYVGIFVHHPAVTTLKSADNFPDLMPGFEQILVVTLPQILIASTFLLFWGGTVTILYANLRRVGKVRFWILVTTPIIFFLGTLISLYPEMQVPLPKSDPNSIAIPIYITNYSQIIAIGLFATAFVIMARAIPSHRISDYIYITCYGLTLYSIGIIATVSGAGYPPFGLPTVSLVGPFSFLLFTGLNHSAISAAEDSNLRRSIKASARQQLNLLDSIGTAEILETLEKKMLGVIKANAENLKKESGIEPSLSLTEAKEYLNEVIDEVKNRKSSNGNSAKI